MEIKQRGLFKILYLDVEISQLNLQSRRQLSASCEMENLFTQTFINLDVSITSNKRQIPKNVNLLLLSVKVVQL